MGGYWISRRALAPVDEITLTAKSIGIQNLSQRLNVPATGDEFAAAFRNLERHAGAAGIGGQASLTIHGRRIARVAHAGCLDPDDG